MKIKRGFRWEKEKRWIFTHATTGLAPGLRGHILFSRFMVLQNPTAEKQEEPPRYRGVLNSLVCSIKIWRF